MSMTRSGAPVVALSAVLALAATAGCTITESDRISIETQALSYAGGPACASHLGSYTLPKAFLHIRVGQADPDQRPVIMPAPNGEPVEVVRHPDNGLTFCLDYIGSPFADETVRVLKWPTDVADNGKGSFLGAVMVNVTDQTAFIVRALIRTLFIAETGLPGAAPRSLQLTPQQMVADLEFDPFDRRDAAVANARLSKLGYCLVLQHIGFPSDAEIQAYCSAPLVHRLRHSGIYKAYAASQTRPVDPHTHGIVYRPREPYRLMIFHKADPGGRGPWLMTQMMNVELENFSPILSLRIDRTVFAGKNVSFVFKEGTLQTACVSKNSEIAGFTSIPLEIVRSIVSVPATIAAVRIDQIGRQKSLIEAETQLYQVQQIYLKKLAGADVAQPTDLPGKKDATSMTPGNFTLPTDLDATGVTAPALTEQICPGRAV
jgi:hypothetical protein